LRISSRASLGNSSSFKKLPETKILTAVFGFISCLSMRLLNMWVDSSEETSSRGESAM
jgi:hypothetical protein